MKTVDIRAEAMSIVNSEMSTWGRTQFFITSKVALNPRLLIEKCRKNYWGIFDTPIDEQTGREKTWIPLTESTVEDAVKNGDLDTKDITIRTEVPGMEAMSILAKHKVADYLEDTNFGRDLDALIRQCAIDGTVVWKTIVKDGIPQRYLVDLLNFYIDPVADSIAESPAVIERAVISVKDFLAMDGWINKDEVVSSEVLHRNDKELRGDTGKTKYVEIYERWGLMPRYLITNNADDVDLVEGHIVTSKTAVHLIEINTKGARPYEECWWRKIHGRWYGRGVAESLLFLQIYLNTIVNIRITRSYLSQMGLFKIRKGSGITPQMLSRLAVNGGVEVNDIKDIEQFVMQEASQASYNDEENIRSWAQRVSSVFETVTGERLPSGTTATVGSIQATAAQSAFVLIKEGIGMFLQRYLKNQVFPYLKIRKGDILFASGFSDSDLQDIAKQIAQNICLERAEKGEYSDFQQAMMDFQDTTQRIVNNKGQFITTEKEIPLSDFNIKIDVTNESMDKNVLVTNLIQSMSFAPQYADQILPAIFDLLNLNLKKPSAPMPGQGALTPNMATQLPRPQNAQSMPAAMMNAKTM